MTRMTVPIIDITPYRTDLEADTRALASQVNEAGRDIGFLIITWYDVSTELIQSVDEVSRAFFDLPLEEKQINGVEQVNGI